MIEHNFQYQNGYQQVANIIIYFDNFKYKDLTTSPLLKDLNWLIEDGIINFNLSSKLKSKYGIMKINDQLKMFDVNNVGFIEIKIPIKNLEQDFIKLKKWSLINYIDHIVIMYGLSNLNEPQGIKIFRKGKEENDKFYIA